LVDIDGDGDLDAFIGNSNGSTLFFRNTAANNSADPAYAAATSAFGITDVGNYASPSLVDIDGDGDLDAYIGNAEGDILFFRNTAPTAAVTAIADDVGIFQGTVASGDTTDDTSLSISGTISAALADDETVLIYDGTEFLGTAEVYDDGTTWSYNDSRTLSDNQSVSYTARVADAAGNESAAGTAYTAIVDTAAPATTAAVTAITDNAGIVTGTLTSGATTDDISLAISGTLSAALAAGETVRVYDGSTLLGNATVSGNTWSYADSRELINTQSVSYTALVTDAAGNQSTADSTYTATVDLTAPAVRADSKCVTSALA
jgi:hypothetical protein